SAHPATALSPSARSRLRRCYLYCYGARRDLHSFPTRRSSDLRDAVCRPQITQHDVQPFPPHISRAVQDTFQPARPCGHFACGHKDRKSTRLNSSHVKISYAVFCLKKKNPRQKLSNPSVISST